MRWVQVFFYCLLLFFEIHAQKVMTVQGDTVRVYRNKTRQLYEKPLFSLPPGERVRVAEETFNKLRIETEDGRTGWVHRRDLAQKTPDRFYMKELKVFGFLENVDPIYILDFESEAFKPIRVAKDFIYTPGFMNNINREEFEWENEIYYYKDYIFTPQAVKKEKEEEEEKSK